MANTHRAFIVRADMTTELIAAGPQRFCKTQLNNWLVKKPLGPSDEAMVVQVLKIIRSEEVLA